MLGVMQSPGNSPRKQGTLWKWTNYLSGELKCVTIVAIESFFILHQIQGHVCRSHLWCSEIWEWDLSQQSRIIPPPPPPFFLPLSPLPPFKTGWQPRWFILDSGILSYYLGPSEVNQGCRGSLKVASCDIIGEQQIEQYQKVITSSLHHTSPVWLLDLQKMT